MTGYYRWARHAMASRSQPRNIFALCLLAVATVHGQQVTATVSLPANWWGYATPAKSESCEVAPDNKTLELKLTAAGVSTPDLTDRYPGVEWDKQKVAAVLIGDFDRGQAPSVDFASGEADFQAVRARRTPPPVGAARTVGSRPMDMWTVYVVELDARFFKEIPACRFSGFVTPASRTIAPPPGRPNGGGYTFSGGDASRPPTTIDDRAGGGGARPTGASSLTSKIKRIFVEELRVDEKKLTDTANLEKDLDADQMDIDNLDMALQEAFQIEIADKDAESWKTFGDVVRYITKRQASK
jgi:acyl carrier protein